MQPANDDVDIAETWAKTISFSTAHPACLLSDHWHGDRTNYAL